jgi:nucleoside-diphosphate-sugar epimerase
MFSLAQAHQAFSADDRIADPQLQNWFEGNITGFLNLVEAAKHYPCAKSAWIEFLGEANIPATRRVQQ